MQKQTVDPAKIHAGGCITYNFAWCVTSINERAAHIFGHTQEELLGMSFWETCGSAVGSLFFHKCHWTVAQQTPNRFEEFCSWLDGWFEFHIYPIQGGVAVYLQDISERKQLEAAIQGVDHVAPGLPTHPASDVYSYQEMSWKALLDQSPDVIARFDRNLRYIYANAAIEQTTGLKPHTFVGRTHAELGMPKQIYPHWDEAIRHVFETGQEHSMEFEFPSPTGARIYQARLVPELNGQGFPEYVMMVSHDVTESRRVEKERAKLIREQAARAEAERANRIKDEFLAVLSHELRTPLNPILGWTRILRSQPHDDHLLERALGIIERNARVQAQLIEDLLDVSRILQGKLSLQERPVNLALTIEAALETVHLAAEAKHIDIASYYSPTVQEVSGDPNRLQQVVWNLLSNAVKFTPVGGRIEVRLEQRGDQVQIVVRDSGEGISPEFLPYVFDYFRQADASITRSRGGLGLGLAIVHYLVELHGGMVTATSLGKGKGATFTVLLPVKMLRADSCQTPMLPSAINLEKLRVLVVDDEIDSRELTAYLLTQQGATVATAASANEAVKAYREHQPDVVVCDIGLPDTDGYSLLRQIQALNFRREPLAIALTAYASEDDRQRAYQAGFQRHVAKPFEPEKFLSLVADLYHSRR